MRGGTLFSGIGTPELAAPWIDWRWSAEVDSFASAVLACRFPAVPNLGDVTQVDWDAVEPVDIIVFGSPCQSFSVAGKRAGLDDPRGNLALIGLQAVDRIRPDWVVFENVPGLLSSDEWRDFGTFLGALGQCGYGFSYRILDAQFAGVPQRRRRVFVVGYLGDWRCAAAVLLESESLRGNPPPSREAGQGVARPIASSPDGGSGYRNDADTADNLIAFNNTGQGWWNDAETAQAIRKGDNRGGGGARESTLVCGDNNAGVIAFHGSQDPDISGSVSHPLGTNGFSACVAYGGNRQSGSIDVATAVNAHGSPHGRAVAFQENIRGEITISDYAKSLNSGCGKPGQGYPAIAFRTNQTGAQGPIHSVDVTDTLAQDHAPAVIDRTGGTAMAVRRLTPTECERLQGLPDCWTAIKYKGKPASDGPRYRALGNAMVRPVIGWILGRIRQFNELEAGS